MAPGRREERRQAIEILFQADVTGEDPAAVIATWRGSGREIGAFTAELILGVRDERDAIDAILGEAAEGWTVDRMPSLDRTILRVACLELRFREGVPAAVAIDEAVEAAKEMSTEDSSRFVNGVLGRVARG